MIYNINNSVLSLKVKHCMFSMLELVALESSLEVELAEVEAVGLLHLVVSVEVEEGCTTEVHLLRAVNEEVQDLLLKATAAACHNE